MTKITLAYDEDMHNKASQNINVISTEVLYNYHHKSKPQYLVIECIKNRINSVVKQLGIRTHAKHN